jgi:hypothetical protein
VARLPAARNRRPARISAMPEIRFLIGVVCMPG